MSIICHFICEAHLKYFVQNKLKMYIHHKAQESCWNKFVFIQKSIWMISFKNIDQYGMAASGINIVHPALGLSLWLTTGFKEVFVCSKQT